MKALFHPSLLRGELAAPPSKSVAHRYLISAGLAFGESCITGISDSEDMHATLDLLSAMGATYRKEGSTVYICGSDPRARGIAAGCCRESGSTLRFFVPIALLGSEEITLTGAPRLFARPLDIYKQLCRERGLFFRKGDTSVTLKGPLTGGEYTVVGNVSSQFITGLLFALPLCREDSTLRILPPVESRAYLSLTEEALWKFGIRFAKEGDIYFIPGNQCYRAADATVEGDYSNAAFFHAFLLFGDDVRLTGLRADSYQSDAAYLEMFPALAAGTPTLDISQCPDLGPILMAMAAAKNGAVLTGTRRLKIKESDRGAAMAAELAKMGISVNVEDDRITVAGGVPHAPDTPLYGHNDHRIVMALSTLLCKTGGEIQGAEAVKKSLPEYFDMIRSLGAEVTCYEA